MEESLFQVSGQWIFLSDSNSLWEKQRHCSSVQFGSIFWNVFNYWILGKVQSSWSISPETGGASFSLIVCCGLAVQYLKIIWFSLSPLPLSWVFLLSRKWTSIIKMSLESDHISGYFSSERNQQIKKKILHIQQWRMRRKMEKLQQTPKERKKAHKHTCPWN